MKLLKLIFNLGDVFIHNGVAVLAIEFDEFFKQTLHVILLQSIYDVLFKIMTI